MSFPKLINSGTKDESLSDAIELHFAPITSSLKTVPLLELSYARMVRCGHLTVLDMGHGAVILDVDIQSVGVEVFGYHHARLNDTALLGEILLAKVLSDCMY